jgi:N-acetylmuramoyl-L-alanine amidase
MDNKNIIYKQNSNDISENASEKEIYGSEQSENEYNEQFAISSKQPIPNIKSKNAAVLYIDAGHGGVFDYTLPAPNGYTTYKNTRSKLFDHKDKITKRFKILNNGEPAEFHQNGYFYEGLANREYTNLLSFALSDFVKDGKLDIKRTYKEVEDNSLEQRVAIANADFKNRKKENSDIKALFYSQHFNASGKGEARGIRVFTTVGKTQSDIAAEYILQSMVGIFGENLRGEPQKAAVSSETKDGDLDYEKDFYVIRKTDMPAVLCEGGFFDNFEDAKLIFYSLDYKAKIIKSLAYGICQFLGLDNSKIKPIKTATIG